MYFSWPARKVPKEAGIGEALRAKAPSPMYPTRRNTFRCSKMFRFLNTYNRKKLWVFPCRLVKIGTFSPVGWRCGWGFQRGRIFEAPLWPTSLVTFLFGDKKVTSPVLYKKLYFLDNLKPRQITLPGFLLLCYVFVNRITAGGQRRPEPCLRRCRCT